MCALVRGMTDILTPPNLIINSDFSLNAVQGGTINMTVPNNTVHNIYNGWKIGNAGGSFEFKLSINNKRLVVEAILTSKTTNTPEIDIIITPDFMPSAGQAITMMADMNIISDPNNNIARIRDSSSSKIQLYASYSKTRSLDISYFTTTPTNHRWVVECNDSMTVGTTIKFEFYNPIEVYGAFVDLSYKDGLDKALNYLYPHNHTWVTESMSASFHWKRIAEVRNMVQYTSNKGFIIFGSNDIKFRFKSGYAGTDNLSTLKWCVHSYDEYDVQLVLAFGGDLNCNFMYLHVDVLNPNNYVKNGITCKWQYPRWRLAFEKPTTTPNNNQMFSVFVEAYYDNNRVSSGATIMVETNSDYIYNPLLDHLNINGDNDTMIGSEVVPVARTNATITMPTL